jgi:hypothetical protein
LADVDVPILCIPVDAKYKKTETIGFTTRFRPKDKKALKKSREIGKNGGCGCKMSVCETNKSDVTKKQLKMEKDFEQNQLNFLS